MTPYIHPERRVEKIRPLKAYRHMRNLLADKEDTAQVFYIIEALNGNSLQRDMARTLATPAGQRMHAERLNLAQYLDDHETLSQTAPSSVAQVYMAFMKREGLSAAGLIAETDTFWEGKRRFDDDVDWYGDWRRDTHDLLHIMTGYGRDALGEACVLAFSNAQHGGPGAKFISHMAARRIRKLAPKNAPVMAAVRQAARNGKACAIVAREPMQDLLAENLTEARLRLGIKPPTLYDKTLDVFAQNGLEPATVGT